MSEVAAQSNAESNAAAVVQTLRDGGHVAYFAGGCVRDRLLGLPPEDYDVATDAPPDRVRKLFKNTQAVGAAFGVILVRLGGSMIEVATFRSDGVYEDGRRPGSVTFATAEADAQRRDFTINGLFYSPTPGRAMDVSDPAAGEIIDYVGGVADLKNATLRAIGDPAARFEEDHLRLLRAVRFAARFGLTVDPATSAAIDAASPKLPRISAERIAEELRRILTAPTRDAGFQLLWRHGLLRVLLPTIARPATETSPAPVPAQPHSSRVESGPAGTGVEGTGTSDSLRPKSAEAVIDAPHSLLLNLAPGEPIAFPVAWLATMIDVRWHASRFKPDVLGNLSPADVVKLVALAMSTLRPSNHELEAMTDIARLCREVLHTPSPDDAMLKRFLARPAATQARQLLNAFAAIGVVVDRIAALRLRFAALSLGDVAPSPLLTGDLLIRAGCRPGPAFKRTLDAVYDAQLNGQITDADAALTLGRSLLPNI